MLFDQEKTTLSNWPSPLFLKKNRFGKAGTKASDLPEEKKLPFVSCWAPYNYTTIHMKTIKLRRISWKNTPLRLCRLCARKQIIKFNTGSWEYEMGGGIWNLSGDWSDIALPNGQLTMGTGGYFNRVYWSAHFMGGLGCELLYDATGGQRQQLLPPGCRRTGFDFLLNAGSNWVIRFTAAKG